MSTPHLLTCNELGDLEDIDRFVLPQGVSKPSFSVICVAHFSDFRIDLDIDIYTHVAVFLRHELSRRNQIGFQNFSRLQMRC